MTELAYLEKVDPSRRMMRFYAIWIAPTLFGEWAMVREWGRVWLSRPVTRELVCDGKDRQPGGPDSEKKEAGTRI